MIRKSVHFFFVALLTAVCLAQSESDPAALFEEGNRLYAAQDYEGARKTYEQCIEAGARNSAVFLNLGHTEYKLGRPALALVNYRRALALEPGNDAARRSLEEVQKELGLSSEGLGFPQIAGRLVPFDFLALAGSLFVWGGLLLALYGLFSGRKRGAVVALGILLAALGATVAVVAWQGDSRLALSQTAVVTKDIPAYSSPSENSQKQASLRTGEPVRVIATGDDGWSLVTLPTGVKGWVRTDVLQRVLPEGR